ncbi:Aste57867_1726 [Aphanomyces stellatus]|uniref:Aste57867_1726 protein n=1 Tax=Aphanomyces stellatus TaxID=120398 RepID=A0A485K5Z6_9STRA|nr:hypothetical protein As57867_001724 [Aphanomyces stellatus]VFT78937.1 Aste57867_1726 [Aphanomyces stellatus]
MSCCPPNSLPVVPTKSDMVPVQMGGTPVFFYDHPTSHTCVLVFPDAFGPDSGRTKLDCAALSAHFKVVLVDLTDEYIVDVADAAAWLKRFPFETLVGKIDAVIAHLMRHHDVAICGAVGYCWGAWLVAKMCSRPTPAIHCGVSFHPSWQIEDLFGGSGAGLADTMTAPQLVLTAGNDAEWLKPGGQVALTLDARHIPSKFREFDAMTHGWVSRGDMNDPLTAACARAAWHDEALPFLQQHLKRAP